MSLSFFFILVFNEAKKTARFVTHMVNDIAFFFNGLESNFLTAFLFCFFFCFGIFETNV